jgi:hypothetical protein
MKKPALHERDLVGVELLGVRWNDGPNAVYFGVAVQDKDDPDAWYFPWDQTWEYPDEIEILRTFPGIPDSADFYKTLAGYLLELYRNNPIAPSRLVRRKWRTSDGITRPLESAGWLSPAGEFYACLYHDHGYVAERISATINQTSDGFDALMDLGWVHISSSGEMEFGKLLQAFTPGQRATLARVLDARPQDWFAGSITDYLEER